MKVTYDPTVDILRIVLGEARIAESDEQKPGVVLDVGEDGIILGIEILEASKRVDNPRAVEYDVTV